MNNNWKIIIGNEIMMRKEFEEIVWVGVWRWRWKGKGGIDIESVRWQGSGPRGSIWNIEYFGLLLGIGD